MDRVKDQLADILRSDEIRDKLGDAKQTLYRYHTNKTLGAWREKAVESTDQNLVVYRLTQAARHLAGHTMIRTMIEVEVNSLLAEYGDQPISALIPDQTRQQLDEQLGRELVTRWTEFFQSEAFEAAIKS